MTDRSPSTAPHAGAPFAAMLRGALVPSVAAGLATVVVLVVVRGGDALAGAVIGLVVAAAATIGDLIESSIKRDLGIKDMGTLLPGHGGLMDRLDSLVLCVPVVWALLLWAAP